MANEAEKEGSIRIEAALTPEDLARTDIGGVVQIQFVNQNGEVIATIPGTVVQTSDEEQVQINGSVRRGVQILVSPEALQAVYQNLGGDPKRQSGSVFFKGTGVALGTLSKPKDPESN